MENISDISKKRNILKANMQIILYQGVLQECKYTFIAFKIKINYFNLFND